MTDATLSYVNGEPTLRFERRLRHAPAKVWRAVTDPAELKHWFPAAVELELRPGSPMRFTFPSADPVTDGEVLEFDEPKVFMFRWNQDVLRIELIPSDDGGCLLVFTQTIGGGRIGLLGAGRTAAGWDTCLDQLAAGLDGDSAPERTDWVTPMAHYIDKFGLGDGVVDGRALRFARDLVWKQPVDTWPVLRSEVAGRMLREEPPRLLEYETENSTVRWEFLSDPKLGERVELTVLTDEPVPALAEWHHRLELFFSAVMGDTRAWSADRVAELTRHYEALTPR